MGSNHHHHHRRSGDNGGDSGDDTYVCCSVYASCNVSHPRPDRWGSWMLPSLNLSTRRPADLPRRVAEGTSNLLSRRQPVGTWGFASFPPVTKASNKPAHGRKLFSMFLQNRRRHKSNRDASQRNKESHKPDSPGNFGRVALIHWALMIKSASK